MTTIGFATLQIIPSLKGVSEAIEKEVAGKTVKVSVEPTVDTRTAQKAGKEAGEAVTKEVKSAVRKGDIGKTVHDEIKTSAKSSGGKEAAKSVVDGIADGIKNELPRKGLGRTIVEGIADGVKQGIDGVGIGGQVVDTIGKGVKSGNLGGTLKDAIVPAIKGIGDELRSGAESWAGDIADSLRSGDIQGATKEIGDTVQATTDLIADIGDTFGLQLDGVREFGTNAATTLSQVGTDVQNVIGTASDLKGTFTEVGNILETVLPGKAGAGAAKISAALASISIPAAIAALLIYEGGKLGGDILGKNIDALGGDQTPAGRNAKNQMFSPGFGIPGAVNAPIFQVAPDQTFGGPGAQRERRGAPPPPGLFGPNGFLTYPYSSGGYTGSMPANKIAGVVHGGEYVINARATAGIDKAMPGLLPFLNNLPGYKGGGKVQLGNVSAPGITTQEQQSMWDAVRSNFPSAILSSATRTVMTEGHPDYHNAGRAIDISGPGMGSIAAWIASNYPDSLELIHSPFGRNIKNGRSVGDGMSFYGAGLMAAHQDHVHWALGRTAAAVTKSADASVEAMSGQMSIGQAISTPTLGSDTAASTGSTSINLASSFSGLAATGLDGLGPKTKASPDSPERTFNIGKAGAAAVGGQVSSLLSTFGINESPGWLQGIAGVVNAVSVNKGSAGSVAPMSAATSAVSAAGSALGSLQVGSGAAPGPVTNFNIQTTDLEPAYLASQRLERERAAARMAAL